MSLISELILKMDALGTRAGVVSHDLKALINQRPTLTVVTDAIATAKTEVLATVTTMISALRSEIMGGMPAAALDTIMELSTAVAGGASQTAALLTAIGETIRFTSQSLTPAQQTQARLNIGAAESVDLGESLLTGYNPTAAFDAAYNAP